MDDTLHNIALLPYDIANHIRLMARPVFDRVKAMVGGKPGNMLHDDRPGVLNRREDREVLRIVKIIALLRHMNSIARTLNQYFTSTGIAPDENALALYLSTALRETINGEIQLTFKEIGNVANPLERANEKLLGGVSTFLLQMRMQEEFYYNWTHAPGVPLMPLSPNNPSEPTADDECDPFFVYRALRVLGTDIETQKRNSPTPNYWYFYFNKLDVERLTNRMKLQQFVSVFCEWLECLQPDHRKFLAGMAKEGLIYYIKRNIFAGDETRDTPLEMKNDPPPSTLFKDGVVGRFGAQRQVRGKKTRQPTKRKPAPRKK